MCHRPSSPSQILPCKRMESRHGEAFCTISGHSYDILSSTAQLAEAGQAARRQRTVDQHNEETHLMSLLQLARCLLSWRGLCWRLEMSLCLKGLAELSKLPRRRPSRSWPSVRSLRPCRGPSLWLRLPPQTLRSVLILLCRRVSNMCCGAISAAAPAQHSPEVCNTAVATVTAVGTMSAGCHPAIKAGISLAATLRNIAVQYLQYASYLP